MPDNAEVTKRRCVGSGDPTAASPRSQPARR